METSSIFRHLSPLSGKALQVFGAALFIIDIFVCILDSMLKYIFPGNVVTNIKNSPSAIDDNPIF